MDKRIKYSLKQKQAVVKAVISGRESSNSAARRIGANPTTVKRWVNLYNYQGIDGLKRRNSIYNGKFKIEVIRYMLKNQLSLTKTAALFGISHDQIVALWLKKYEGLGASGLLKETRGRKKSTMAKESKKRIKVRLSKQMRN